MTKALKFRYRILPHPSLAHNRYRFVVTEQDRGLQPMAGHPYTIYVTRNGWQIRISSSPEICKSDRIIYIKGSSGEDECHFIAEGWHLADITAALEDFQKRHCKQGEFHNHHLTHIFV